MRHYQLVPVRYNAQQLLTPCEPIDAELWSIQWEERRIVETENTPYRYQARSVSRMRWFADVAPLERDNAEAIVAWLNNRESFAATLPPLSDVRPFK